MGWLALLPLLVYPFVVSTGLFRAHPRLLALAVLAALAVAWLARRRRARPDAGLALAAGTSAAVAALLGFVVADETFLRLLPAGIHVALLAVFAASLGRGECVVERIARLQVPDLPPEERHYCRVVTLVWCAFFVLNGALITWLALAGTTAQWAAHTGVVSYLLIGGLFAAEYLYRHYRFRRYVGAPGDALLKRLFPPRGSR